MSKQYDLAVEQLEANRADAINYAESKIKPVRTINIFGTDYPVTLRESRQSDIENADDRYLSTFAD